MSPVQPLGAVCSLINDIPGTFISSVWFWISYGFSNYWYVIIPALVLWVIFEIVTRNTHSFNSDNGFTPTFNSFVGGGVFLGFESLIHFVLNLLVGNSAECGLIWINSFYLIPFVSTSLFLNAIGFWSYMRIPIINVKIDLFGRGSRW